MAARRIVIAFRMVMFTLTGAIVAMSVPKVGLALGGVVALGALLARQHGLTRKEMSLPLVAAGAATTLLAAVASTSLVVDHTTSELLPAQPIVQCVDHPATPGC